MKNVVRFLLPFVLACLVRGAPTPPDAEPPPLTARELQQGFRERVILARPHAARRATADAEEARDGLRIRERFARLRDLRVIDVDAADDTRRAIERLRASGRYEFVEPDYLRYLAVEPNDPQFVSGAQWALKNPGPSQGGGILGADLKAPQAWDLVREAPNVVVAVVDTGVNLTHPDLAANLWRNPAPTFGDVHGASFVNGQQSGDPSDDSGHGTHIAGTIGAVGNNGTGIAGIAWRVQIMAVKVFPASGPGSVSDIARGVNYAVSRGAHLINASYGALGNTGFSNTELAAINAAREAGVIFVAAAGNSGTNMDVSRFYPANHALDNIVTVGNSTRRDELALSSNYGSAVDLFAPGSEIVSLSHNPTAQNQGVATSSGTSMAAPHVTGALALLKARFPADTHRQLINRLLRGTEPSVNPNPTFANRAATGGRLNLLAALSTTTNRPFNDDFASRPRFSSQNLALRGSNAGATPDPQGSEPAHAGFPATATLWWEWTAPTTNVVSIDTGGSTYDTVLAVYTGNTLPSLTPIASNDDDASKVTSRVSFTAAAGTTYQIAVDGKNGGNGLTLLNVGTTPANDMFAAPVVISGESTILSGTNLRCTLEPGEPRIPNATGGTFDGGTSLWYRWTAPRTGRFQVSAVSNDFDPILAAYTGASLTALALVEPAFNRSANEKSNGAIWTINALAGTAYTIAVDSKDPRAVGQFTLSVVDSTWQFQADNAITGAPAIARDGTIYFGSIDSSLYAIAPDGTRKWSHDTGGLIDTCSPAIADDGSVYVGSNDGRVYAFRADGTPKWERDLGAPASNSPTIAADGTVYVKAGDGFLHAIEPGSGGEKWRFNLNGPQTYGSAAVAPDGTIYQGSDNGRLYAINPDGTQKWVFQHAQSSDIYTAPAIDAAGNIYFSVLNTGRLFAVSPSGTLRWIYSDAATGSSSSAALSADGGTIYYAGYDRKLHAVDTASGSARWTYPLGDEVRASSPAVDANGVIYVGCYDYKLYAVNPNGTLKRTYATGNWIRSCPAIFGNALYIGSNDRKLYAFDIGAGPGGGPWPQYRHNARRTGRAVPELFAITAAPQSQVAVLGMPLTLSVTATGDGPLSYEWRKDGVLIAGVTGPTLTVPQVTAATAGAYSVTVRSAQGALPSAPAVIVVEPPTAGRLVNLSVRTTAGTGAETLIVGFAVRGAATKPLLVRGIGPTLAQFGVGGALADPQLQIVSRANAIIASNDNWSSAPNAALLASTAAAVGAFALPADSRDAVVLLTNLAADTYTAQVTGSGGATGIALAEIYDTESTSPQTANVSRLVNVSARAQVGTGGSILIAGFTVSGNMPKQVLVRGIGPSLGGFGITGALANPQLEIHRAGSRLEVNDDWGGSTTLANLFTQLGAFPMSGTASRDAALLVTLAPGSYTAQLSGVGATTGVGLIEVYEVPE